ncbi:DUF2357 domain-containing protein [Pseudomonas fluorescens]|uniref:DUF2357 domain-containing protein n=1 Tax=Pseudomonas fluorescens TaxID=294 RepID=A0AAP8Z2T7_PSEFL|nr:DUF2357 domain-containing protein [Pseudomonas fluorescens]QBX42228.1 DUF2357 domain-containing protein [Pseudomonas fluorescens]
MRFIARIISGKRKDQIFELSSIEAHIGENIYFLEDEAIEFRLELERPVDDITLCLHENEISATNNFKEGEKWIYEWKPKSLAKWGYECFFHNYYGMAELVLATKIDNYNERIIIEQFSPIEVLAKKINAERAEKMLSFLAAHDNEALAAFFRVTRLKAGFKEGDKSVSFLIDQLERNVLLLSAELPKIYSKPIAKLIPVTKVVAFSENSIIDDTTLAWIAENCDGLFSVDDIERALLEFDSELYSSEKILENHLKEELSIYENQVVHGFIISLMRAASELLRRLEDYPASKIRTQQDLSGYLSFFSQLSKYAKIINRKKAERCRELIEALQGLKRKFDDKVPVTTPIIGTPQFTRKARYNLHYQKIFHKIIAWHRFGSPDWSVQEELFSIQSIPKLFEYYLLFLVKNHLDTETVLGEKLELLQNPSLSKNDFEYQWGEYNIKIMYEPKAWTHEHLQSSASQIINSEGWTFNHHNGDLKPRGQTGANANRCPDILLAITSSDGETRQLIIDAKYTNSKKAFTHYLPELTMKYLHGLHEKETGLNPSIGLMIVNPSEQCTTRHFHHQRYSIYGATPVTPALLVSSITPGETEEKNSDLKNNISQFLYLMRSSFKKEDRKTYLEIVA